jgi:thiol peroxidase
MLNLVIGAWSLGLLSPSVALQVIVELGYFKSAWKSPLIPDPILLKDAKMANTRSDVTFKGGAVNVAGTVLKVGDSAPDFSLQSTGLEEITLANSAGKTRIIATVPSLDTGVCSEETKKFNEMAKSNPGVEILVVSMDLPFAIKRWCGAEGVSNVNTLSAHRCTKFAEDYGVLLSEGVLDRLLIRAVIVEDGQGKLKHVDYVKEITDHPNSEAAIAATK